MPDIAPDANSIAAKIGAEAHAAVEAKLQAWFGRESEMAAYDADAVLELGRHVI